jgi:hypothetical protein
MARHPSLLFRTVVSITAATVAMLTVAGCSSSGTPSAASVSSSATPASSSVSAASPPPVTTTATPTPTTRAPSTETPATTGTAPTEASTSGPTTDLAGEVYGRIVAVDPATSEITLDKVDWFTGPAAEQACDEDGVTERNNGRCTIYYFRNRNPMLRVLTVSPDATVVTLIAGSPNEQASDLGTVQERLAGPESSGLFRLTVTDGQVTSIQELYFP